MDKYGKSRPYARLINPVHYNIVRVWSEHKPERIEAVSLWSGYRLIHVRQTL